MRGFLACLMLPLIWSADGAAEDGENAPLKSLVETNRKSGEAYWEELRAACRECFGGLDATIEIGGGVERREFESGPRTGPFAEARLSVPLFSRSKKQLAREAERRYLEHGAGLIGELEEARALVAVLVEQGEVLNQSLLQEGLEGLHAYFLIRVQAEKARVTARAAERKLDGWIGSCGNRGKP
jgi:hypothetical protein